MIDFTKVKKSYSGKIGCMCGCNGTYQIPEHVSIEDANKAVGYEAFDKQSNRSVKSTVTKMNKLIDWNRPDLANPDNRDMYVGEDYAFVETSGRCLTVWFE